MITEYAPKAHRGVTQLQYVSGIDDAESSTPHPLLRAAQDGLLVMGLSSLLGIAPETARLLGIVSVGFSLTCRR